MSTNIQMLEVAVGHLEPLLEEVVFVGGATIELWISDPLVPPVRATADVDVVVAPPRCNADQGVDSRL